MAWTIEDLWFWWSDCSWNDYGHYTAWLLATGITAWKAVCQNLDRGDQQQMKSCVGVESIQSILSGQLPWERMVMVNFVLLDWAMVSRYLIKHYYGFFCEGIFVCVCVCAEQLTRHPVMSFHMGKMSTLDQKWAQSLTINSYSVEISHGIPKV